jgi:glycosyltransferase involved in cell wall biosynthesis
MKVLQIIDKLDVGGAERMLVTIANLQFENNIDTSVLCLLEESVLDSELNKNIPIHYLRRKNKYSFHKLNALNRILNQFDIVHIHSRHVLRFVGLLLFLPKRFRSFKVIYQDHSLLNFKSNFKDKQYFQYILQRVDTIVYVAEEQKKFFPLVPPSFLLENTVRKINAQVCLNADTKKLVAIGNFRRIKNYSLLLEILQKLPKNFTCDIYVGTIDKSYFEENKCAIDTLIAENRLNFIQGELNIQGNLPKYALAIHTSLSESGPLVAVECLSVGLPILMFNTGSVAKNIAAKLPNLIKDKTDSDAWVTSILNYFSDSNEMHAYSKALYQLYLDEYSEDKYLKKCLKIYQNSMNS